NSKTSSRSSPSAIRSCLRTASGSPTRSRSPHSRTTATCRASGSPRWRQENRGRSRAGPARTASRAGRLTARRAPSSRRAAVAGGKATDLTPVEHDVPAIATGGDGDVTVSPDGKDILVAMHFDSTVADNTNVDIYAVDGPVLRQITTNLGADNTPRYSPDNHWATYLSMERPGFEADRVRLMIADRRGGVPTPVAATTGWNLSVRK